jgi:hypothetical protein
MGDIRGERLHDEIEPAYKAGRSSVASCGMTRTKSPIGGGNAGKISQRNVADGKMKRRMRVHRYS